MKKRLHLKLTIISAIVLSSFVLFVLVKSKDDKLNIDIKTETKTSNSISAKGKNILSNLGKIINSWNSQSSNAKKDKKLQGKYKEYKNLELGFSLAYPENFKIQTHKDNAGKAVVFEHSTKENNGFQVFVMPFNEQNQITPKRLRRDLPNIKINNPEYIKIDGVKSLAFFSESENLGKTYEIWFSHKGKLYQVSTYDNLSSFLKNVLETWQFK